MALAHLLEDIIIFSNYDALDKKLDLPAGATRAQVLVAMIGHIIEEVSIVGRYEKVNKK